MKSDPLLLPPRMTDRAQPENGSADGFVIERIETAGASANGPGRLNGFEILYIERAAGYVQVDQHMHLLHNNTFFCLAPGQYRMLCTDGEVQGYKLSFSLPFLLLADGWNHHYTTEWIVPSGCELDTMITRMNQEFPLRDAQSFEVVRSLFRAFMIYLRRKFEGNDAAKGAGKDKLMVQRFFTLLQQHHVAKKLVADYADELCITPNYLNAMVKKQTGYPASFHIHQYIIVDAIRLALYSGLRMKEVAERLGFDDYAHFSKFFKNYSGMNFSDFRRTRVA
jgi:AraC family transcriptional regulator, transcriptional activator of pobA